jgi:hypothetical protein
MFAIRRSKSYSLALLENNSCLEEEFFGIRVGFWKEPSIDCTQYAFDTKRTIDELKKLEHEKGPIDFWYDYPLDFLLPNKLPTSLSRFFDTRTRAFKQTEMTFPDACSIDDAFRVIFKYANWETNDIEKKAERLRGS